MPQVQSKFRLRVKPKNCNFEFLCYKRSGKGKKKSSYLLRPKLLYIENTTICLCDAKVLQKR